MNQQNLVLMKFPFSNQEESKIRPGIIISNNEYNDKKQDVLVCAITSNLTDEEYSILIENKDLLNGSILIKSKIRADKILLIEKKLIIKVLAKLNDEVFDSLVEKIATIIKRIN
ncbi:type II toxin-antitoxin system PemK/MazF family toxin [Candidatus Woesearchaeota archaeon]|nr:type II toxin-antitoxin system PemK/MazF family toxin [Candidatus Woesearchaeota archaeon]